MSTRDLLIDERPPAEGGAQGAPLLLVLHGWGMYKGHLFELTRGLDPRLTIVAAQAPVRMGPGAYRWFDFERTPSSGPIINDREEEQSLATLLAFIDRLVSARAPAALYLLGHSQGATMALSVTLRRPARLAGCANVNGRLLKKRLAEVQSPNALEGLSFFCGHGVHNPIVPLALGRETRDHVQRLGAEVTYREYPIGHEITPEALSDVSAWLTGRLDARAAAR
ncbi:alpha/beta hydrolase [Sorangium sp. So ce1024]|uniref:alpha/beta hydrolase n=1 Tax=Sorangium sp. So ce1024 TaxID=3133327 RepID=UPI003F090437